MNPLSIFLPLFLSMVMLAGCTDVERPVPPQAEEVSYEVVGFGRNSRLQDTTQIRISDAESWQAYADSLSPLGSLQEVDFDKQDVLLIAVPVNSAGYDFEVTDIMRVNDRLRINYVIDTPGEDCLTAQVLLTPFTAVAIEKTSEETIFAPRSVEYRCSVRER